MTFQEDRNYDYTVAKGKGKISNFLVLQRLEAICERLLNAVQQSERTEEASALVSQCQLAEVLAKIARLEMQVARPAGKELKPPPGLGTKEGTVASCRTDFADPSPAKTLVAVVEVPENRKGTEKLDLTMHIRPREYPGQCPRFPAAMELIRIKKEF